MSPFLHYELPKERIAERPASARADSRLLVAKAEGGALRIEDRKFFEVRSSLKPGDLLVLNNSRVMPSRFFGVLARTGGEVEILLLESLNGVQGGGIRYRALGKPLRRLREGDTIELSKHLGAEVLCLDAPSGQLEIAVSLQGEKFQQSKDIEFFIEEEGLMPIPPYIRRGRADRQDRATYQTVFAETAGSVAAPTAGLHFTKELLEQLRAEGIDCAFVTLHVGPASFRPIRDKDVERHKMSRERSFMPETTWQQIEKTKQAGGRVVAVGTTTVRTLESFAVQGRKTDEFFETDLFITPGYTFSLVDVLLTNFHQPCSTHLLLVGAFMGEENIEQIYKHALKLDYRFLSYGDAMLLESG